MIYQKTTVKYISEDVGYGLVATEFIPAGTILWVLSDLDAVYTQKQYEYMPAESQEVIDVYAFRDSVGHYILCWDNARYTNHSFKANCLSTVYSFDVAVRDIHPGEQITNDYGCFNLKKPLATLDEGEGRKVVYPDDHRRCYAVWDAQLLEVFSSIINVPQPMRNLLPEGVWEEVVLVASGGKPMPSSLGNYYSGIDLELDQVLGIEAIT